MRAMTSRSRCAPPAAALALAVCALAVCALTGGCVSNPASFESADPTARNAAIVNAARADDRGETLNLIRQLDSDDAGTRLLAIAALERLTGERLGYDPTAPQATRDDAVERWVAWYSARYGAGEGGAR
jgi:hypothetical protein